MDSTIKLTEKGERDYQLVLKAIQNDDQRAYSALVKNYRDSLYYMLLKMTNSPVDAEDLTIEAFGKAFRNLDQYTPDFAFSTWLFKIASNNCIDYIRKLKKSPISHIDNLNEDVEKNTSGEIPFEGPDPEENFIKSQKIEIMRKVVDQLKPKYKRLIELRYFKELSYEELATVMGVPMGTVKAQLFRAREVLFRLLKNNQDII